MISLLRVVEYGIFPGSLEEGEILILAAIMLGALAFIQSAISSHPHVNEQRTSEQCGAPGGVLL